MHGQVGDAAALAAAAVLASDRIAAVTRLTPALDSLWLSGQVGADVALKLENLQVTGSFKIRGAANKVLLCDHETRNRGFVTASTGNHGLAMAYITSRLSLSCITYVPRTATPAKLDLLKQMGTSVIVAGEDAVESEAAAREHADSTGQCFVSPYNDMDVIAGQGTVGVELTRQLPELDAVLVAVGGGGLVSGVAAAVKAVWPECRVIGCSPSVSPVMQMSVAAGIAVEIPLAKTISDGTAGGVEHDSVTIGLCSELVDAWWDAGEAEIEGTLLRFIAEERHIIEGAAAVPVACLLEHADELRGARVGVVLCGGNISLSKLGRLASAGSSG